MATVMDGKALAAKTREAVAAETAKLPRRPTFAAILVGDNPASVTYVRNKENDCRQCGIDCRKITLPDTVTEAELLALIADLNGDPAIDSVMVQMPLPEQIDEAKVKAAVLPEKDVDAFHPSNVGNIMTGTARFLPCTPAGILELLKEYGIDPDGKICVVVGRSNIVGKPMGMLFLQANGTVVYTHSHTPDLPAVTRQADILVAAVGRRGLVTADMVKPGAVVIDVGMNRDTELNRWFGDVDFGPVSEKASFITPVPGGVGPMTRAMLMKNILIASKLAQGIE